ncbi:hypothetical protein M3Y94_00145200 [Aphelenchoides besseyi]|nr:hypothetical protein M3Y94_00145200 [Aphelenchoides besseyi]
MAYKSVQHYGLLLSIIFFQTSGGNFFYTDENSEQSARLNLSSEHLTEFRSQILSVLGLKQTPEHSQNADRFASNFMSALYSRALEGPVDDQDLAFSTDDVWEFRNADTVISFMPREIRMSNERFGSGLYELNFVLNRENETSVERQRLSVARLYVGVERFVRNVTTTIRVFRKAFGAELVSIGERDVSNDFEIVSLNITQMVAEWLTETDPVVPSNHRIFVEFVAENGRVLTLPNSSAVHCFAVAFFTDDQNVEKNTRKRRSVSETNDLPSTASPAAAYPGYRRAEALARGRVSQKCGVRSLYVDFKDLGWNEWIVAPSGYFADFCSGSCSFPLDTSAQVNHAIVQSLVNLLDKRQAAAPSCAPIELQSQRILFLNQEQNLVMKRYHHMRVLRCGCQ